MNVIRRHAWWWGSAVLAFVASFLPYWIWSGSFGRILVTPNVIFDSYLYFQQISLVKAGIDTGSFSWFSWPLKALIWVMPHASIPEVWIVSRVVTTALLFWLGAWCIKKLTGTTKDVSRWLIVCFWFSFLLVIGMRPGVFSWYLPFGFLGVGLLTVVADAFDEKRWMKGAAFVLLGLLVMNLYPWFVMYELVFVATLVAVELIKRSHERWVYALTAVATLVICTYAFLVATGTMTFHVPASFLSYERNSITFSYIPLISNTVLASGLWLVLLALSTKQSDKRVMLAAWSWIVLLAAWLATPLLGVDLRTDHYIIVVVMLAWANIGLFATDTTHQSKHRRITLGIATFATLFFLYILQKALRHVGKFEPYTIHLSLWSALASAAWLQWNGSLWRCVRWGLLAISVILGVIALTVVVRRGMAEMPELMARVPVMDWIREHVPTDQAVCADPVNAKIYAVHDERLTYPTDSNLMFAESDEAQHARLITIVSAYDTDAAKDTGSLPFLINGLRTYACAQYEFAIRIMERLGVSPDTADRIAGCLEERNAAYEKNVMAAIREHHVDADAFRTKCPWIIIPDDRAAFWHLPTGYEEIRVDAHTSTWHVKR